MIKSWDYLNEYLLIKDKIQKSIDGVLKSGNLFFGKELDKFEKNFLKINNAKYGVAVGSGTDAIYLSLKALNIGYGDEVITVANTAIPTVSAIISTGATVKFIDIGDDFLMNINKLEKAISKKTKVLIPVHLYGQPCNMKKIIKIAKKYKVPIIEDAAEAFGSKVNGKLCGSFCEFGVLSFNVNKIITTAGGGALISKNKKLIDNAKFLASQAKDKHYYYQHSAIGFNYRMSNLSASIGLAQTERFKKIIQKHRSNFNYYKKYLKNDLRFSFLEESKNKILLNRWITVLKFSSKFLKKYSLLQLIEIFRKNKIEVRPLWKPLHLQPIFKDCKYFGSNVSEKIFKSGMCLPSGSNLTNQDLKKVVYILKNLK